MKRMSLFLVVTLLVALVGCSTTDIEKDNNLSSCKKTTLLETDSKEVSNKDNAQNKEEISVVSAESSWAIDVTDPSVVEENSDYFLKVRVKTKEKTKYFVKNSIMPSSTYNLEVLEIIKNNNNNKNVPKNIKIAVNGGVVTKQEYVNTMDEESKKKTKVDTLSNSELKQKILIKDEGYYELEQGKEYYIFVCDITDDKNYNGYYCIREGGYDIFKNNNGV